MQQPPQSSPHHHSSSPMQPPYQPQPMMPPPLQPMMAPLVPEGPRWRALRIVAGMLKVFAWIELVLGLLSALGTTFGMLGVIGLIGRSGSSSGEGSAALLGGALLFLLVALVVGVFFLFLYSISELILLMIAIENNTRPRRS